MKNVTKLLTVILSLLLVLGVRKKTSAMIQVVFLLIANLFALLPKKTVRPLA